MPNEKKPKKPAKSPAPPPSPLPMPPVAATAESKAIEKVAAAIKLVVGGSVPSGENGLVYQLSSGLGGVAEAMNDGADLAQAAIDRMSESLGRIAESIDDVATAITALADAITLRRTEHGQEERQAVQETGQQEAAPGVTVNPRRADDHEAAGPGPEDTQGP